MNLDTLYFDTSLNDWVTLVHSYLCAQYGMDQFEIEPNDYGYDAYSSVICSILMNTTDMDILAALKDQNSINKYIDTAHKAWCINYIKWKQMKKEIATSNPKDSINTYDRNDRATTCTANLSDDDNEMYRYTIKAIFAILSKKLLESGMKQLTI